MTGFFLEVPNKNVICYEYVYHSKYINVQTNKVKKEGINGFITSCDIIGI